LVDRYAAALELYARQRCDPPEDVVQEALVELALQRPMPDEPGAWLVRVVRNGAINAAQAARRRRRHEAQAADKVTIWFEASIDEHPLFHRHVRHPLAPLGLTHDSGIIGT
jgi:DNA-directed RNA polymerase specialized sigma24 family protein